MQDEHCVRFLQWALPRMHLHWPGFRKVRRQVCKRIDRRIQALGLADIDSYRAYLEQHADEWPELDAMCRITISRFYRDKAVFSVLAREILPALATGAHERGARELRIWSAGCGSGEEPVTLAALWYMELQPRFPELAIDIVATDIDSSLLQRAHEGLYIFSSVKDLPETWRDRMFSREQEPFRLDPEFRSDITFLEQDIREEQPGGRFDLVLCRNLVFTYFDEALQRLVLDRIVKAMRDGAALVLGVHEQMPGGVTELSRWRDQQPVYRKTDGASPARHKRI